MERLTNIGSNGEIWITDNDETRRFGRKESAYKKLVEYEDEEEQGLLLHLPCKVGDTVYYILGIPKETPCVIEHCAFELSDIRKIGKTLFLTKAEAEQKLKEMESD